MPRATNSLRPILALGTATSPPVSLSLNGHFISSCVPAFPVLLFHRFIFNHHLISHANHRRHQRISGRKQLQHPTDGLTDNRMDRWMYE